MQVDKIAACENLMSPSDFKVIHLDGKSYLYLADTMQIFDLDDPRILDYCRICNTRRKRVETDLTARDIAKIDKFIKRQSDNGPQPHFIDVAPGRISGLIMNVAKDCNLDCRYCFAYDERWSGQARMDYSQAKDSVDFLVESNPEVTAFTLTFFGGEPFLNFDVIKRLVRYCERKYVKGQGKKFGYSATTNGTVLTDKMLDFMIRHHVSLVVSLDGPKNIQDSNRSYKNGRSSFSRIMKNIDKLKNTNIKFMLRPTITADCQDIMEIVHFMDGFELAYGLEFVQKTNFKDSDETIFSRDSLKGLRKQYTQMLNHFCDLIDRGESVYCMNIFNSFRQIHYQMPKDIPCMAGRTSLTVNPDGTLFSCQNITNSMEICLGTCKSGINEDMLRMTSARSVYDMPNCRRCWARLLCGGACLAEKYVDNGTFVRPVKETCAIRKIQWEGYLELYQKIMNRHPDWMENVRPYDDLPNH